MDERNHHPELTYWVAASDLLVPFFGDSRIKILLTVLSHHHQLVVPNMTRNDVYLGLEQSPIQKSRPRETEQLRVVIGVRTQQLTDSAARRPPIKLLCWCSNAANAN